MASQANKTVSPTYANARIAASIMFLVDGMGFGTWAALIPSFKAIFALSDAALGGVLFSMVTGALIAMPITGYAIARWGSNVVLSRLSLAYCVSLLLLACMPNLTLFVACAFLFGACKGTVDVAVNSQAVTVENKIGKPIMSTFQALWSIGGLIAALIVGSALHFHFPPKTIAGVLSILLFIIAAINGSKLLPDLTHSQIKKSTYFRPNPTLLKMGLMAFLVLFAEGAMMDWSAVYAKSVSGATYALAAAAYALFSFAMAVGRLTGDVFIARVGSITTMRLGGLLIVAGIAVVCFLHYLPLTYLGFTVAGLGLSNLFPIILGVGGRAHEHGSGPGIATITTIGFFGFLVGPPAVGFLSNVFSLPVSMALIMLFGVVIALWGTRFIAAESTS